MVAIHRVHDLSDLCTTAALKFIDTVATLQAPGGGVHQDGVARVVLTGGGAGIGMLKELARLDSAASAQQDSYPALRIDWSRIHVFFGDERNVDVSDPESNEGQARTALLDHVSIPSAHIHGYGLGETDVQAAAKNYEATLAEFAPRGFDIHLLGMGGEGHINSLFPHTTAVAEENTKVTAVLDSPKPPAERVSLTLPAVNAAQQVWFLVAGEEKAEAASHIVAGSPATDWPAAGAHGTQSTHLFVAEDAASQL